jgi:hypothetical protein
VAAILLRLAGVAIQTIADDYALSGIRLEPRHRRWLESAETEEERRRIERIAATPRDGMAGVLEAVDDRYGGVDGYLLEGGLLHGVVDAARARLR